MALALWLPHYLIDVYGVDVKTAGMAAASFSLSASLFRAYGGHLSDKFGARSVMYWTFGFSLVLLFMLSYPPTDYVIQGKDGPIAFSTSMGLWPFVIILFALGFFMSLGKAAVFKHIPVYYPQHVGAVGGLVGMIGGLGGFVLPIAFGALLDLTGIYTSCFALLFVLVGIALSWMHLSIRAMERKARGRGTRPASGAAGDGRDPRPRPDRDAAHARGLAPRGSGLLGRDGPARRAAESLDLDPRTAPGLLGLDGVVDGRRPAARHRLRLHARTALLARGASRRCRARRSGSSTASWCRSSAGGSGRRCRPRRSSCPPSGSATPCRIPRPPTSSSSTLALLCGLGGANFASSMANIGYFFPKAEKGNALALNAGLGNLGVSVMQFLVPIVITAGVFGAMGGAPQELSDGGQLWMQNAGFVWVPFIIAATVAAWLGMNDIADAKASFAQQAVIFGRTHNWLMCVLYIGTFGSFIGYSAGFPLLTKLAFPDVNALQYVFLGPLVGRALPRRHGLGQRPMGRGPGHLLGLRGHDPLGLRRHHGACRRDRSSASSRASWRSSR